MKIAVIGSGVSGLAATWLLNEHSNHEVHLYEADSRPGGHANTVHFTPPDGREKDGIDVDTGFVVFNPITYPNFLRFLKRFPSIRILPTEMTFSMSRDNGLFEWAGKNIFTIFCQPSRIFDPKHWRLIYDVLRFNACATRFITESKKSSELDDCSIGEYLRREGYSSAFSDNYLIPTTAAIWSTPADKCAMDFPAYTLIQFMHNHHLLQVTGRPSWSTLHGGSYVYVKSILSTLPEGQLHLSMPVLSVSNLPADPNLRPVIQLTTRDGNISSYDHVIMACHSDTSLSILKAGKGLTEEEGRILGSFRWSKNEVILHSDTNLMPRSRVAWSCWNYLSTSTKNAEGKRQANSDDVALTYSMNLLQHIPENKYGPVLVTLNAPLEPQADKIVGRYKYEHPVLDSQAIHAQEEIATIQGRRGISYAGAWLRCGFHEDGFTSGLRAVAEHIDGVNLPFEIRNPDRDPEHIKMAQFLDILENTGARAMIGTALSFALIFCRHILGLIFDFSHLDE